MNGTPEVWHAGPDEGLPENTRHSPWWAARMVLSLALAVGLLVYALPRVVGTTVYEVLRALELVTGPESVVLALVWAAGLYVYSFTLTAALPGLSRQRAFNLNLTGSAVANVLPFGGAAGMSLNYLMIRSWGFGAAGFSSYTLVTNVWSILMKLALPALALAALILTGQPVSTTIYWTALGAAAVLAGSVVALTAGLATRRAAVRVAVAVAPPVARLCRLVRRPTSPAIVVEALLDFRDRVAGVIGDRWLQLSLGSVGYGVLQALLLWACLRSVGADLSPVVVLAAYAVDRIMSMVVLTPGGAGFAEAGAAATLVALGGAPAVMTAGVLLYRGFIFALEIPVGGTWLAGWLFLRRRNARAAEVGAESVETPVGAGLRILHVSDYYRPRVGGIEMFVEELAERQSAAGDDVTVLCPTRGPASRAAGDTVEVIRTPVSAPWPLPILPGKDVLQLSSYDVVHAHLSVATPYTTRVAMAAVGAGIPVVATVHSMWTGREPWVRIIGAIAGWDRWPVEWTAVSGAAAAAMQETLGSHTPVHVVPNAVEVPWWREHPKVSDPCRPFTVVTVMRLAGRKRPMPLLEILERTRRAVPDDVPLRAIVIGQGPLEHKMRQHIASLGADDWVEMAGGLSRAEIREIYRHADAYVAPSHQESFGLAALEARAAGLPVVAMRSGGVGEFVRQGVEGFICQDDSEMADALVRLATDPALRERMAAYSSAHPPVLDWSVPLAGFAAAYDRAQQASTSTRRPPRTRLPVR